jgi:single-stranded-DNA-specific exonuclease
MRWVFPENQNTDAINWMFNQRNPSGSSAFFSPSIDDLHDPFLLHDMQKAVKAIADAVKNKEKIFIYGDYDVDGVTATSILWSFLYKDLHADVLPHIPNRFTDGYGLNEDAVKEIIGAGGKLIITVDCGVKDIQLVEKYSSKINFIITDHHSIRHFTEEEDVKGSKRVGDYVISDKSLAVVHPALPNYPFKDICAAVVSWKLCQALNTFMSIGVDVSKYLELAALGTVCDVMPLVDENRSIVKLGLERMTETQNIGIKSLLKVSDARLDNLDAYHLGFVLGPRLNASGRLESAMEAVRLLTTSSQAFAEELALKLNDLNNQRRELTIRYLKEAEDVLTESDLKQNLLFVYGNDWPEGIVGLIAGKLSEKYSRPVIAGSIRNGVLKGSARSISSFNIAENLKALSTYLQAHGGHSQAAGLTVSEENLINFKKLLIENANKSIRAEDMQKSLLIDALADFNEITMQMALKLKSLSPFGFMNKKPLIAVKNLSIRSHKFLGSEMSHVRLGLTDGTNGEIEAIGFGLADAFKDISSSAGSKLSIDIAGFPDINSWKGKDRLSFKIEALKRTDK